MTSETQYLLGLSGMDRGFAVSLLVDGRVEFAIEEDKLRRFKGLGLRDIETVGSRAVAEALERVPGGIRQIDQVVYTPPIHSDSVTSKRHASRIRRFLDQHHGHVPEVFLSDHLAAHFAFERAVHGAWIDVFMVGRSRAVYSSPQSDTYELDIDFPFVSFVENCAHFIGIGRGRIHHLENLARLGEARFLQQLRGLIEDGFDLDQTERTLSKLTDRPRRCPGGTLERVHYDLAASLFELMRDEIVELLKSVLAEESSRTVALCGGVFQSWRLNDAVADSFPDHDFTVSFSPGNPACAIGGPLALTGLLPNHTVGPFLGPKYNSHEIKAVLDNCKARYAYHSQKDATRLACEALEAGKMVGWFAGPCEFGYRALGARSVFANPADRYACDNLSSYLKKRPEYFPYAVALRDGNRDTDVRSPFLSRSTRLPQYFSDSPVRLQTVSRSVVPGLYELLSAFEARTGVEALLNTSLNYFDEPIACTPRDALKTFYASGLDLLVMENFVLSKS